MQASGFKNNKFIGVCASDNKNSESEDKDYPFKTSEKKGITSSQTFKSK